VHSRSGSQPIYRDFPASLGALLGPCVAALLAVSFLSVVASAPAGARAPRIRKPGAPTGVVANPVNSDTALAVSWTAPSSNGGSTITGYTVTVTPGEGQTCSTTGALTCTVDSLAARRYMVKVRASNAVGQGKAAKIQATVPNCEDLEPYADLQSCDLEGTDLPDGNLTGANLTEADLDPLEQDLKFKVSDLSGANLSGATLTDAQVNNAILNDIDLSGASLIGASIQSAEMMEANLTDANLTDANLNGTSLAGSTFTGTTWSNTTCPDGTNSDNDGGTCVNNLA
jgi:fibronectin type III domain protein/pentapeptide repeat protein